MDTTTKAIAVGIAALLLAGGALAGIAFAEYSGDREPVSNEAPETNETAETTEPQPVDETNVSKYVLDSKAGAGDLKRAFMSEYQYESRVFIQDDGQVILHYTSEAQSGNQLKNEMKQVSLLYADVAAENPEMGALTIQANGAALIVPADTAIAHGNGDINEEAYFKNMRWESTNTANSTQE